jgi:hypothetical protein
LKQYLGETMTRVTNEKHPDLRSIRRFKPGTTQITMMKGHHKINGIFTFKSFDGHTMTIIRNGKTTREVVNQYLRVFEYHEKSLGSEIYFY